ncbi:MAG: MBL fold metallo-hydrolase [Proteobacteria bacterium]|nr:MAG: MBL fold metallo-hydrolase [Pseudomonadota bacterium]
MQSRITILGSGTCVPSLTRHPCAFILQTGGHTLLFDCGPGTMHRLLEVGVAISELSHIFLSHFHPDHSSELAAILFALNYGVPAAPKRPLTIVAGRGFKMFFNRLKALYGSWIELPPDRFSIVEMATTRKDSYDFGNVSVLTMPVNHRPESIAFRVEDAAGKVLVYSGDTDICDSLAMIAADADLMICESAFPDGQKADGHLTPSLAGTIAATACVRNLLLTHFYPPCDQVDIEKQCRSTYSGSVTLAKDKMTLTL